MVGIFLEGFDLAHPALGGDLASTRLVARIVLTWGGQVLPSICYSRRRRDGCSTYSDGNFARTFSASDQQIE
jgi:hypothetical protein